MSDKPGGASSNLYDESKADTSLTQIEATEHSEMHGVLKTTYSGKNLVSANYNMPMGSNQPMQNMNAAQAAKLQKLKKQNYIKAPYQLNTKG